MEIVKVKPRKQTKKKAQRIDPSKPFFSYFVLNCMYIFVFDTNWFFFSREMSSANFASGTT